MLYKVYADGTELEIVSADSPQQAILHCKREYEVEFNRHIVWTTESYPGDNTTYIDRN